MIGELTWIPAAKAGMVIAIKKKLCTVTAESLEQSLGTWKGKPIFKNHATRLKDYIIHDERYETPFLSFLLDRPTVTALANGAGGSIDAIGTMVKDRKLMAMLGVGYSVLDKGKTPACTPESGCGIAGERIAGELIILGEEVKGMVEEVDEHEGEIEEIGTYDPQTGKYIPSYRKDVVEQPFMPGSGFEEPGCEGLKVGDLKPAEFQPLTWNPRANGGRGAYQAAGYETDEIEEVE